MASKKNALSSLIHRLDPDYYTGVHFLPTYEEGIRIVQIKNAGGKLLPIFKEDVHLFQCRPEELLEECNCFTKLKPAGKNKAKANRTLGDGSRRYYWKNIKSEVVRADNNNVIGCVTKLVLHKDKNTPTEWHILQYMDTKKPDADRWVLCEISKSEKNNDSGGSGGFPSAGQIDHSTSQVSSMWASGAREDMNQVRHYEMGQCSNTQPDWLMFNAATYQHPTGEHMNQNEIHGVDHIGAGQIDHSTSQVSSMWASGAREDMNRVRHYEMGQCSNTQPDWLMFNAATYQHPTGEHMNQNEIHGVDHIGAGQIYPSTSQVSSMNQIPGAGQYGYHPQGDVVNNPQQFPSCTYSNGGTDTDMGELNEIIN